MNVEDEKTGGQTVPGWQSVGSRKRKGGSERYVVLPVARQQHVDVQAEVGCDESETRWYGTQQLGG